MALREWLITCKNFTQRRKGAKKRRSIFLSLRVSETRLPLLLIGWVLLITAQHSLAQSQRGMTPADTLRLANVGDVQIAPDGSMVCYTVSTTEGNATRTALWCAQLVDERVVPALPRPAAQQVLGGNWNVSRPRWSPDGRRLAF